MGCGVEGEGVGDVDPSGRRKDGRSVDPGGPLCKATQAAVEAAQKNTLESVRLGNRNGVGFASVQNGHTDTLTWKCNSCCRERKVVLTRPFNHFPLA